MANLLGRAYILADLSIGGNVSYAQISDIQLKFDQRLLGDLASDGNVRVTNLTGNPVIQSALDAASGQINSAILKGERYTVADLQALTGVDAAFLIDLTCNLAFLKLRIRRGMPIDGFPYLDQALATLEALGTGQAVFNVPAVLEAGVPIDEFPSMQYWARLNLLRDRATPGYFSIRRYQQNQGS
jgi:phage gp36-like protein